MLLCCGEFLSTITFQWLIILYCLVYSEVTGILIFILSTVLTVYSSKSLLLKMVFMNCSSSSLADPPVGRSRGHETTPPNPELCVKLCGGLCSVNADSFPQNASRWSLACLSVSCILFGRRSIAAFTARWWSSFGLVPAAWPKKRNLLSVTSSDAEISPVLTLTSMLVVCLVYDIRRMRRKLFEVI